MNIRVSARLVATAVALVVVAAGGGYAWATSHQPPTVIACVSGKSIVVAGPSGNCALSSQTRVELVTTAYQGFGLSCPTGTLLYLGLCFESGVRAAATHGDASRDCGDESKRLPSEGELRSIRVSGAATLASAEWTDELSDTDVESVFLYAAVGTFGSGIAVATDRLAYRCVGGPTG